MFTIYVDMDGVIADFEQHVIDSFGKPTKSFKSSKELWTAISQHPTWYRDLPMCKNARAFISKVASLKADFNIKLGTLTGIPLRTSMPTAAKDKRHWMNERFRSTPELIENFKIGPYSVDKQNHCEGSTFVLIDDNEQNIDQWNAKGGFGILHKGNFTETYKTLLAYLEANS